MCFSPKAQKFQNDFLKFYDKHLNNKLLKAQIYIKSNKELISRNEKLKYQKNSCQKEKNRINLGIILLNNNQLLNKSYLNNCKNKNSSKNNTNNPKEKQLISTNSFNLFTCFHLLL